MYTAGLDAVSARIKDVRSSIFTVFLQKHHELRKGWNYDILNFITRWGGEGPWECLSHESLITYKLQRLTCQLCHVHSSGTTLPASPRSPSPFTRRPLLMLHFIMQHDGKSGVKLSLLSRKQLPSPADKGKPSSEWRAEWAERLREPYGQLQLVPLTSLWVPGWRPVLGTVPPEPFLAKYSSISGNLPALSGWLSWESKSWHHEFLLSKNHMFCFHF